MLLLLYPAKRGKDETRKKYQGGHGREKGLKRRQTERREIKGSDKGGGGKKGTKEKSIRDKGNVGRMLESKKKKTEK